MGLSQKDRIIFATTLLCCLLKVDVPKGARSYRKEKDGIKLISEINIRGQVLLTTHSPLTLNKINKENIRILKDGEIYSLTVDSFNRDVVQILEEIMEVPKRPKEVEDAIKHFRNAVMHNQKDEANKAIENLKRLLNKDDPFWVKGNTTHEKNFSSSLIFN